MHILKKILLIVFCLLLFIIENIAQNVSNNASFYTNDTIHLSTFAYFLCKPDTGSYIRISRTDSRWTKCFLTDSVLSREGTSINIPVITDGWRSHEFKNIRELALLSVVYRDKDRLIQSGLHPDLIGHGLELCIFTDIKTGKVLEVEFRLDTLTAWVKIHPSRLYRIEQSIIKFVSAEFDEKGEIQNYHVSHHYTNNPIVGNGFVYMCRYDPVFININNVNNQLMDVPVTVTGHVDMGYVPDIDGYNSYLAYKKIIEIMLSVLTLAEKTMLIQSDLNPPGSSVFGYTLRITLRFDPETGKVKEVEFSFNDIYLSPWLKIPPERLFAMEQLILQNINVEVTEAGKLRNYIRYDIFVTHDDLMGIIPPYNPRLW
jgi:hypothetical protein